MEGHHRDIFASRKEASSASAIQADAVTVVAVVQEAGEARLVMTREFRAPLRAYELSLPSGLIDPGESPLETAVREFKEETGLTLDRVMHVSPPTSSSGGLTDETVAFVFGEVSGSMYTRGSSHAGPALERPRGKHMTNRGRRMYGHQSRVQ